jgi:putative transposase
MGGALSGKGSTGVPPVRGGTGFQPVTGVRQTRRNLPHIEEPGRTYFVTFRARDGQISEPARGIVLGACLFWRNTKYRLHACFVMPDHVHLLLTPLPTRERQAVHSLGEIMHSIKSYSAKQLNELLSRTGSLWLDERFDRIVRSHEDFIEKWSYIRNNPVKAGLALEPSGYSFLYEDVGVDPGFGPEAGHRQDACATQKERQPGDS